MLQQTRLEEVLRVHQAENSSQTFHRYLLLCLLSSLLRDIVVSMSLSFYLVFFGLSTPVFLVSHFLFLTLTNIVKVTVTVSSSLSTCLSQIDTYFFRDIYFAFLSFPPLLRLFFSPTAEGEGGEMFEFITEKY